jgi:hypothetical protein
MNQQENNRFNALKFDYEYARDNLDDESTKYDWVEYHQLKKEYFNMINRIELKNE